MSGYTYMSMGSMHPNAWTQAQYEQIPSAHDYSYEQQPFNPQAYAQYGGAEGFSYSETLQYGNYDPDVAWDSWTNGYDNTVPQNFPSASGWGQAHSTTTTQPSPSSSFYVSEPSISAPPFSFDDFEASAFGTFDTQGGSDDEPIYLPDSNAGAGPSCSTAWTNSGNPTNSLGFYAPQLLDGARPYEIFETSPYGVFQDNGFHQEHPGPSKACKTAYPPAATARPLKRRFNFAEEDGVERPAKRLRIKSSRSKRSEREKTLRSTAHLWTAGQTLPAVVQGDGRATLARRQVDQESTRTHVLEFTTTKSGASQQVGASNGETSEQRRLREEEEECSTEAEKTRLLERRIIEASIGQPAPYLGDLTEGLHTLADVQKIVGERQICHFRDSNSECCGKAFGASHNAREFHYRDEHGSTYPPLGSGQDRELVTCPQPGCGEKVERVHLDFHLRQRKKHLLPDIRFLRLVCPKGCPVKRNDFVPGSRAFHDELKRHKDRCPYRGPYKWEVVDFEPDLAKYFVKPERKPSVRREVERGEEARGSES